MFAFDHSYASLPPKFFRRVHPTPVAAPQVIAFNKALADELGLGDVDPAAPETAMWLSGNALPEGALPLAMAYAGHQFGNFVPQLGDGRAILIGEVIDRNGMRRDIQLKGSGPTPFSRNGDGRAALGPVLREYIVSEAMYALGIPATRALAAVLTGDDVYRETVMPGAVFTRVAASHIRVGTFQFFAARGDKEGLAELVDYVIGRHYPDLADATNKPLALLDAVIERQAKLIARWMGVGFIHGVMNTDNMTVSGETIDFGPCAFMDAHNSAKVFSSIDRQGRYAYQNQPAIAQWNLARLAETLLGLIHESEEEAIKIATTSLERFADHYEAAWLDVVSAKLGLMTRRPEDGALAGWLLSVMQDAGADFTRSFRALYRVVADPSSEAAFVACFNQAPGLVDWLAAWRERLELDAEAGAGRAERMRLANPAFIPRNHRIEQAIQAGLQGDFAPFHRLNAVLSQPFDDQPESIEYAEAPLPEEEVTRTFCGT